MCDPRSAAPLTRRHFLAAGAAAGVAAILSACRPAAPPLSGRFGRRVSATVPLPSGFPHLAGRIAERADGTLALLAPVGERLLLTPGEAPRYSPEGSRLKSLPPQADALIWLQENAIGALQQLPPLAATGDIPATLSAQMEPSGETGQSGPLTLITRAGWGAAPPQWLPGGEEPFDAQRNPYGYLVYPEPLAPWLTTLVVHHAALEFSDGPRAIQRLHILRKRFADVGYHFFVDGLGQLYEGRPLGIRGAHTGGYNTGTVGVCLLGNFELIPPLQAQLETVQRLANALREIYGITHLAGHRDFQPEATVCPGATLWPVLPELAEQAGLAYGTGGYLPPPW